MRLVEYVPNSHYSLAESSRMIAKHAGDFSQCECGKGVAATLQRRADRWRMDELAKSQDYGGMIKVCWGYILAHQIVR